MANSKIKTHFIEKEFRAFMTMAASTLFFFLLFLLLSSFPPSLQQQQLSSFSLRDSPWPPDKERILISPNSTFAAGFRSISSTNQSYIFAIWFQKVPDRTIVWSLNGDNPVNGSTPLVITPSGELQLNSSDGKNLWNNAAGRSNGSDLVLHENGELIYDEWTSFDHPTDTIVPNQPFLRSSTTLISRKNSSSYASGNFQLKDASILTFNATDNYWPDQSNTFRNLTSDGVLIMESSDNPTFIAADVGSTPLRRLTLDVDGNLRLYSWDSKSKLWTVVWRALQEPCKIHGSCGPNFVCMSNSDESKTCICPPGFQEVGDACKRKMDLSSDPSASRFLRLDFVNFTGGANQTSVYAANLTVCEAGCRANPRCLGYAAKFDGSQYCVHQIDRLMDGYWSPASEVAMFLRVNINETDQSNFTGMRSVLQTVCPVRVKLPFPPKQSSAKRRNLAIICSLFALELISGVLSFWAFLRKYSKYRDMARTFGLEFLPAGGPKRFSYAELKSATNDFSNVVGHGGFGVVYRGELPDHRIIAVKKLKNIAGGEAEFWAEVRIIARMHHLNLVRMWGFCAEKGQRMLVYEYIPNGSLDKFLFPPPRFEASNSNSSSGTNSAPLRRPLLDWNIRYRIAVGVARAIAYLHEECLEWVLHCDIKPENILLEDDFCPKVSDFGLAKLGKKEDKVSMSRIRGTRGYMAPEWVTMEEPITAKADVYSFGMVLLEIVSGTRNFEFRRLSMESADFYLPRWTFEKVYVEGKLEELLDRRIIEMYDSRAHLGMVDRMVKTAMWCLQDRPEMRPSMGKVAKMLEGTVEITEPEKPTIFYLCDN